MTWIEEYNDFSEKDKVLFGQCANKLLSQTYMVAQNENDKVYFRFCKLHLSILKEYFLMSGWELKITGQRENVFALTNKFDSNRLNLTLSQSLLLFILSLDFQEKSQNLSLLDKVFISNQEIREKYMALNISKRLPPMEEMVKTLKLFQKHSLLTLIQGDWTNENAVFQLYDSILICVPVESINQIQKWIEEYESGEEDNDEEYNETPDDTVALF